MKSQQNSNKKDPSGYFCFPMQLHKASLCDCIGCPKAGPLGPTMYHATAPLQGLCGHIGQGFDH